MLVLEFNYGAWISVRPYSISRCYFHDSFNFYLEASLSRGLIAVWWVPLDWCITYDFFPGWLPPPWRFAFCVLSEPYPVCTLFGKFTANLIITKIEIEQLLNIVRMLTFLPIKGKWRSAAHLRNCKLASRLVPLSILGRQLMPQSLSLF